VGVRGAGALVHRSSDRDLAATDEEFTHTRVGSTIKGALRHLKA
jgi:hypothetical protein